MLTRFYPLHSVFFQRYYHGTLALAFKKKGQSEEKRYFMKKHEEQLKDLHTHLKRLDSLQKQLKAEMNETSKMLRDVEEEENEDTDDETEK